jgi:TPR repeat protein
VGAWAGPLIRAFVPIIVIAAGAPAWAGVKDLPAETLEQRAAPAFRQLLPRAVHGDTAAQFKMGLAFEKGLSAPEDFAEAARWYRRAATQGHARAQHNLGILYLKGAGVPRDGVQAHVWFSLAADRFGYGQRHDKAAELRDGTARLLTSAQRLEAEEMYRTMMLMFESGF